MSTLFCYATEHCLDRAKSRRGYNEKIASSNINKAIARGKSADFFTSWERDYLERISHEATAIAYDGFCYIISTSGFCITMFPLPPWFGKKKRFDGKTTIRNVKKYSRYYSDDSETYEQYEDII